MRQRVLATMALGLLALCLAALPGAVAAPLGQPSIGIRWAFYVTYNPNSLQSLSANARHLTHVSPWFYNLGADGRITGNDRPDVSQIIRAAGAKSLPMVKNSSAEYNAFTALVSDPAKVDSIAEQIDAIVTNNNYDGITLDFEALNPDDKTRLTILASRVFDRLHPKGKQVAIAVAPKTRDVATGWAAAYDYPALGRVVDYVLIMAYDYAWVNGDPGAIAPLPRLRDTANYTLARIPARQVIWGVGVYGYDWAVGPDGKSLGPAQSRTWAEADAIARRPGAQSGYDATAQAPWARYTDNGQLREVWYENRRSFEAKLNLISERDMAGFGIWRLGQEDPTIWQLVPTLPTPIPVTPTPPFGGIPPADGTPYVAPPPAPTATPTPKPKPAACNPVEAFQSTAEKLYFPETGHTLSGSFLKYWKANGGLPVFGFPLTEEHKEVSPTDGKTYTVQYFERNRFEYHPENAQPNDVLLGLLGVQSVADRLFPPAAEPAIGPDTLYFPQVQHTISGAFLTYWQKYGGLRQFGYPITEPLLELSDIDGKTYSVQYFERARFELHPEYAGTEAEVLLGLLGLDISPCRD
ncbi:MAG TPA: glycosyl hydrolase family 18 protein [Chloroflexia bacterium]|nr:glycosyl hydrolase family 18 protein [Chloroflexia bacterium]